MNAQEIISKAKDHIHNKEYAKARVLLELIPSNAVAADLLTKLDAYEARMVVIKAARKRGQGGGTLAPTKRVKSSPASASPAPIVVVNKKENEIPRPAL